MASPALDEVVEVRFVGNDDVFEHVYNLSEARSPKKGAGKRLASKTRSSVQEEDTLIDVLTEEAPVPTGLHANGDSVTGRQMFNLKCTPTAKHAVKVAPKTSTSARRKSSATSSQLPVQKETPYRLRRKIKQNLSKMKEEERGSSSSESDSEKSSSDDEKRNSADMDPYDESGKGYFSLSGKGNTSNHTLSKLGRPVMAPDEINRILEAACDPHATHRRALLRQHKTRFSLWWALLREGFNLLLHGPGSKIKLLQSFKDDMLSESFCVTVNGFNPGLTLQEILTTIIRQVIGQDSSPAPGLAGQVDHIVEHFSKEDADELYLLINNIDGPNLRQSKAQAVLSRLSAVAHIHIVASVDHVNASLLWDQETSRAYRFVWINATTFEPYVLESSLEPLKSCAASTLGSLQHVFCSLTPNARKIFLLIARHQLDSASSPGYSGLSFQDCYHRCREEFLVNSDLTLRAQLREFLDHLLLKIKKGHDGTENLLIPLQNEALRLFVEQKEEDDR
ncbi:origin recognition complex subunit 2 [Ixodes scapularis]